MQVPTNTRFLENNYSWYVYTFQKLSVYIHQDDIQHADINRII